MGRKEALARAKVETLPGKQGVGRALGRLSLVLHMQLDPACSSTPSILPFSSSRAPPYSNSRPLHSLDPRSLPSSSNNSHVLSSS